MVEVLVVIGIISVLVALMLPAVQISRAAARTTECRNKLRQIALATLNFESNHKRLPVGKDSVQTNVRRLERSWLVPLLPFLEQESLYKTSEEAYGSMPSPYISYHHTPLITAVGAFACPEDSRVAYTQMSSTLGEPVGLTSYIGVSGLRYRDQLGVLTFDEEVRLADVPDGTSNTLLCGERPPSNDFNYGWWYAGQGQDGSGSVDMIMGLRELVAAQNLSGTIQRYKCSEKDGHFQPGQVDRDCDCLHFWSLHHGGTHFALVDGSVHFFAYGSRDVLEQMATKAGNEVFESPVR